MDSGPDPIGGLFADCADRLARVVYLVNGHERDAATVVHAAFAGASWHKAAAWPDTPESWIRAHALRLAGSAGGELRRCLRRPHRRPEHVALLRALSELTPARRTALVLRHVVGLDARGIALETDATVGAAAARLEHAHADLAHHPWAEEVGTLLRRAASDAEIRLLPPTAARALPRRRGNHAVHLAGAGLATVVLVPWAASGLGAGSRAEFASSTTLVGPQADRATAERERQAAFEDALAARRAGMREESGRDVDWRSDTRPADFLPYLESRPPLTTSDEAGSDLGFVTAAFLHHDKVYLSVTGGQTGLQRTYRVSTEAKIVPGKALKAALRRSEERDVPLTWFLWHVQRKDVGVPMELRYNGAGRIIRIAESRTAR